jgi:hypothetical protein
LPPVSTSDWQPWLETEFTWSESSALRYMRVQAAFGKSVTVTDLEPIDLKALYLLEAAEPAGRD